MAGLAQKRAVANYRRRIAKQGLARFEVIGHERDKALIRDLARRLAADNAEAARLREQLQGVSNPLEAKGGFWTMIRNSPLVGADLDLSRPVVPERDVLL